LGTAETKICSRTGDDPRQQFEMLTSLRVSIVEGAQLGWRYPIKIGLSEAEIIARNRPVMRPPFGRCQAGKGFSDSAGASAEGSGSAPKNDSHASLQSWPEVFSVNQELTKLSLISG
jgi:hypothetical protein